MEQSDQQTDHTRRRARAGAVNRKTQSAAILRLLTDARGEWVPLWKILELRIGQYGARILEIRRSGVEVQNKKERDDEGRIRSWYRLVRNPDPLSLKDCD